MLGIVEKLLENATVSKFSAPPAGPLRPRGPNVFETVFTLSHESAAPFQIRSAPHGPERRSDHPTTDGRNTVTGLVRRCTLIGARRPVCCLLHGRDGSGRCPWMSWQVNLRAHRVRIACDAQGGVMPGIAHRFPRAPRRLGRALGRGAPESSRDSLNRAEQA